MTNTVFARKDEKPVNKKKVYDPVYHKKYYELNKEKFKQKIHCDVCGGNYLYSNRSKHMNTKKHRRVHNELKESYHNYIVKGLGQLLMDKLQIDNNDIEVLSDDIKKMIAAKKEV
jgi:methyl coenzyme M reductase alpha subunit